MKVLVCEFDLKLRRSMRASLIRWGYDVRAAGKVEGARKILGQKEPPQIAIIDCSGGFEILEKIRNFRGGDSLFILATVSSVTAGKDSRANDSITKPFQEKDLEVRIRAAQRIVELERELSVKASIDSLTGICNRAAIIEALEKELSRSRRNYSFVAIAMLDLDHFKKINDTFGHLSGDVVLKNAAQCVLNALRDYDVLGRYGGEEFLMVLPGCDLKAGVRVAERIREQLAQQKFIVAGHEISVTVSIGLAVTKSGKLDPELLIELADQALYRAKSAGRNQVQTALSISEDAADSEMTREAIMEQLQIEIAHREQTEASLRKAEERFDLISKATNNAIWEWDLVTNQVWSSEGVQTLFGYVEVSSGDSSRWSERIHPDDVDRVNQGIQCVLETKKDFWAEEYRYRRANGTYASILDRGYVLYDENGKGIRMMGAMIDMSDRKRSEVVQSALFRISEATNSAKDMQHLYRTIHSIVGELMYAANLYIALYDSKTNLISFPYWVDEQDPVPPDPLSAEKGLTAYVIREGKPLLSTNENWEEFQQKTEVTLVGAYSLDWLGVPLISGEEVIGAVVVQSYSENIRFSDQDKELLTFVSQHITTALKRKKTEMVQSALYSISKAANSAQNMEELYRTIHEIVGQLMDARNFYIALYDSATNMISFPYFVDEFDPGPDPMRAGKGMTAYIIRTGEPLLAPPPVFHALCRAGEVELAGPPSIDWLGVPLRTGEETFGALVVQSYTEKTHLGESEKELLTFVSQHIGAALKRRKTEAEREKAEEALIESERKYRTLFEESKDPLFISTPGGKLLDINPACVELFGYSSREEMLKINTADLFQDPAERITYEAAILEHKYLKDYELHLQRKDGQKITVLETASVVTDEKGFPISYRGALRDITNLKLLQEKLLQSQKMETVGRLAGGIAHDFNNLLMAISSYCELIELKYGSDELLMQFMKEIEKATDRGAGLTRQLLAFSRKQIVKFVPVDLNAVIANMDRMIDRMLGENIHLNLQMQTVNRIMGDPGQVEQVIMNLVVNARDALPNGGSLTIETKNVDLADQFLEHQPGSYVLLKITDTGFGMDELTRSRIFEPFFSTKGLGKGTGLGLATVYGIVQQMGGSITVSSEPNKGSSFEIYFPQRVDPVETTDQVAPQRLEPQKGNEVLLLVDDNETVRSAIGSSLSLYGYHVLQACDGVEALRVACNYDGKIKLLITDVVMPRMNGRQLASELTAQFPDVKVLYMSGYTDETIFENGTMETNTHFLQKPVPTSELLAKIRQLLDSAE